MGGFKQLFKLKPLSVVLFYLLFSSCKTGSTFKRLIFYGTEITVPDYLIVDKEKTDIQSCKANHYLKNRDGTMSISFELCNYAYRERPSFILLNKYFEESFDVMKTEILDLHFVDKKSYNKDERYYEFTYEFISNGKFFKTIRFAYEKFYIGIKIECEDKNQIRDLATSFELIKSNNFYNNITLTEYEKRSTCLSCYFPSPW